MWETEVAHSFFPLVTIRPIVLGNSRLIQSLALGRHCFPYTYGQTRNAYSCAGECPDGKPIATKHKYSLCYSSAWTSQLPKEKEPHLASSTGNTTPASSHFLMHQELHPALAFVFECMMCQVCVHIYRHVEVKG